MEVDPVLAGYDVMAMDKFTKSAAVKILTLVYCVVALVEVTAEYFANEALIWMSKPILMPLLGAIYLLSTNRANYIFVLALVFSWASNIFFMPGLADDFITASFLFLGYRILVLYLVIRMVRLPGILPIILGSVPFLFIYLYVINDAYDSLGDQTYMFAAQGIFLSLLGGFAVGSYVLSSSRANTLLLMSSLMFAATQFIFIIHLFYASFSILQSMTIAFYALGQFALCRFVLIAECKKADLEVPAEISLMDGDGDY